MGEPNPLSRSRDFTEDTVSERSSTATGARESADAADFGEDGPASVETSVATGDGRGRPADGRTGGSIGS